ncbi:MAG TPA: transposase, partial [Longimicrobiales bacterium]|nr:transposase [Longimicrobiales bacterium]
LSELGPGKALTRAVRRRANLVSDRTATHNRIRALLELLGPAYLEVLGDGDYPKTALALLGHFGDPRTLRRLGKARLAAFLAKGSRGQWGQAKAEQLLDAAAEAISLWEGGGMDFSELAWDLASEVRMAEAIDGELGALDRRIEDLYDKADPERIVASAPAVGTTLAAGVLGRLGDARRFANLAAVRSFSGMVPKTDQSGTAEGSPGITKAGDPGLRRDLWFAADGARKVDPQLAALYYRLVVERGLHHTSAVCHVATKLLTRMASCWRTQQHYILRDTDGRGVTEAEGREIVASCYGISEEVRRARRKTRKAREQKGRTGRRSEESTEAAPTLDPSALKTTREV